MFERENRSFHHLAALRASFVLLFAAALGSLGSVGCEELAQHRRETKIDKLGPRVLGHYADIAYAAYGDALSSARVLQAAVGALVASPTAERLRAARTAWLAARVPYAQTEVFRFYDGPIDEVEMFVNGWPVDENYIEGADGRATGIIDDVKRYPEITAEVLTRANEKGAETNISTGYHALEFLLWGRDTNPDGPGTRAQADFIGEAGSSADRRGRYAMRASELLIAHLERVHEAWAPERAHNYRSRFLSLPKATALRLILKGMGMLSGPELAGERLTVAYETKDQENEHSCFSDSTRDDVVQDAQGIENVCLGRYRSAERGLLQGPGVCNLLAELDPALATELTRATADSVQAARRIPGPFDRAILGADSAPGRVAVRRTIGALETQAAVLARAAALLGPGEMASSSEPVR